MKVNELIKLLTKLDGEMEVVTEVVIQGDWGYVDVIGTDTILLLDDSLTSSRAVVIKTKR